MNNPKNLSDIFGRFFVVAGYIPALLLLTLVRWLIIPGLPAEVQKQYSLITDTGYISDITLLLIIPVLFAAILIGSSDFIIKLYSGRSLPRHRKPRLGKYEEFIALVREMEKRIPLLKIANRDKDAELTNEIRNGIPELYLLIDELRKMTGGVIFFKPESLHTTRMGNVLASLSEYPDRRFGMNAGTIWPRLQAIFPKEFDERLKSQNTSFLFELNLSVCCLLFIFLWVPFGVACLAGWSQVAVSTWLIVFILTWAGFYLFYRAAVSEATILVEFMMTAFDMFRGNLLEKFGLHIPATIAEEKNLWRNLTDFLILGNEDLLPPKEKTQVNE